jgi:hypothetical protein
MEKTNTIVTYDIGRKTGKRPCIPMKYMASVGVLLLQPPQRCQAAELAQNNQRHLQFLFSNQNPPSSSILWIIPRETKNMARTTHFGGPHPRAGTFFGKIQNLYIYASEPKAILCTSQHLTRWISYHLHPKPTSYLVISISLRGIRVLGFGNRRR